ncbi:MAG: PIN domain-containing protein, partial [Candidatus Atribacteria bacterium]|nr:PIN domain-containing protein [Candidatus Atribacteria bacterium]
PVVKKKMKGVHQKDEVVTCGIVIVELLRGMNDESSFKQLQELLRSLSCLSIDNQAINKASEWGFLLDRRGKIVPTSDLLIAAVSLQKAFLLHCDKHFEAIAEIADIEQERLNA